MVSKDQSIGWLILLVCAFVAILYVATLFFPSWLANIIGQNKADVQFWVIAVPVLVAFLAIMIIGAWIGWTMATTPPPKPIEELTMDKEEVKVEETTATLEEPAPEEKKPERKKKGE